MKTVEYYKISETLNHRPFNHHPDMSTENQKKEDVGIRITVEFTYVVRRFQDPMIYLLISTLEEVSRCFSRTKGSTK